jgi:hypothetical protein
MRVAQGRFRGPPLQPKSRSGLSGALLVAPCTLVVLALLLGGRSERLALARGGYGESCASSAKDCDPGGLCVKLGGSAAVCTTGCDEKKPCPRGDRCLELQGGEPAAAAAGTGAPATAAAQVTRFCLPQAVTKDLCPSCADAAAAAAAKQKKAAAAKKAEPKMGGATKTERLEHVIHGGGPVKCLVRAIHGSGQQAPGPQGPPPSIDPRLSSLQKQLSMRPFASFKTIKLLNTKEIELPESSSTSVTLPSGKILMLAFKERVQRRPGAEIVLRLRLSISTPKPSPKERRFGTTFTIASQGTLLVAGDHYRGGTLVVGITCANK